MSRTYQLEPCDETYFESAPHVYRFPMQLPVPPERVWEGLIAANSVASWTPLLKSIEWTSELGPGTTRKVVMPTGAMYLNEYFFRWEEGRRYSFYATESNVPIFGRLAEDYLVEPSGSGSRFTWTFALEGRRSTALALTALSPGNALFFRRMAYGAKSYFAKNP
jgi:hypothetical protein